MNNIKDLRYLQLPDIDGKTNLRTIYIRYEKPSIITHVKELFRCAKSKVQTLC